MYINRKSYRIKHLAIGIGIVMTFMLAVLLVFAAYGGHIDPERGTVFALATLAFPFVFIVSLMAALLWIIVGQWRVSLLLFLAMGLSWPTVRVISPFNISTHKPTAKQDSTMFKVLTFNVMNFNVMKVGDDSVGNKQGQATVNYILNQDADVVLLQEASLNADYNDLKLMKPYMKEIKKKYPYRDHGYHDQIIWSKHPYTKVEDPAVKEGFAAPDDPVNSYHFYARAFDVLVPGHTVRIFNIHLNSIGLSLDDRKAFVEMTDLKAEGSRERLKRVRYTLIGKLGLAFRKHAQQARIIREVIDQSDENVIVCGDFNDTPQSFAYRTVRGSDMHDAWMECGFGPTYTFHGSRLYFKIDQVLYRGDMIATSCHRDRAGSSDHYPLVTTFVWKN